MPAIKHGPEGGGLMGNWATAATVFGLAAALLFITAGAAWMGYINLASATDWTVGDVGFVGVVATIVSIVCYGKSEGGL